jgi:GntR family transcriptional regulator
VTTLLDPRQPTPLWAQLATELRDRLAMGAYGERFPTESELTSEFDVSRATVREAVRRLRDEGLVDARRGSGTFVVRRELDEPILGTPELARAIRTAGLDEESRVLRFVEGLAGPEAAGQLGVGPTSAVVWVERLRLAGGQPLSLDRSAVTLTATARRALLRSDLAHGSLYEALAERCDVRVTGGRERVRAAVCPPSDRQLLQLATTEGVLEVERLAYAGRLPVEWRRSLLRGGAYELTANWGTLPPDQRKAGGP